MNVFKWNVFVCFCLLGSFPLMAKSISIQKKTLDLRAKSSLYETQKIKYQYGAIVSTLQVDEKVISVSVSGANVQNLFEGTQGAIHARKFHEYRRIALGVGLGSLFAYLGGMVYLATRGTVPSSTLGLGPELLLVSSVSSLGFLTLMITGSVYRVSSEKYLRQAVLSYNKELRQALLQTKNKRTAGTSMVSPISPLPSTTLSLAKESF